jgi:1,4-dihydroxy-6-naphthoate synthase
MAAARKLRNKNGDNDQTMIDSARTTIRIGHSPDPDDAFMFHAMANNKIDTGMYHFTHEMADIETLNRRAEKGELEVSAISIHSYPYVRDKYALLASGCSMGDGYGPMVIARRKVPLKGLLGENIAIPGERTTAYLALKLALNDLYFIPHVMMFDKIPQAVASGEVDAGLIIHEAQLTYEKLGLSKIIDLAEWWKTRTGLPLPLGGNVIRRDLGAENMHRIAALLKQSIQYSLDHREEALAYAMQFGRDLDKSLADKFVGMYVNKWTLDYGERGREAVRRLLAEGHAKGLVPDAGTIDFVD